MPANSLLQIRKGTASQWSEVNPVLSSGEPGYDTTNSILKIGDGVSNWSSLNSHKHNISDINGFASGVADTINTEMIGGSGISLIYSSQNNTVTISVTGIVSGGGGGSSGPVTVADITDFNIGVSGLIENIYAPLSSPVFTGVPIVPTANSGSNDNQIANTKFVRNEIASVINSAPEALDTLYELAGALGNDSNFATTITNTLSNKASLSGAIFTGAVTIPSGSINATTLSVTGAPVSTSGHSHSISDILDFDTSVDAKFDTNVVGGSGILLSFDNNTQTLSINALNTGISLSSTDSLPEGSSNLYFTNSRASGASPVQSVAGKTGVVTLSSSDVGLGNVDNTSDTNKPISLAVQSGLDLKAALSHTHTILDVFGLETSLNEKQPSGNYAVLNSSGNFTSLSVNNTGVSLSGHSHSYIDISNFSSGVASSVNTELVGGSGISLDYNSSTNTVNISVTGIVGGGGITGPIYTTGIVDFNTGVSGLLTDYAPLNSPALTGTPIVPTAPTGTNSNQIASTEFVRNEIANLVASAPSTLDTLNEIALSLNNDASFSSTIVSGLAGKASLSGASFSGSVVIPSGSINANILTVDNIPVSVSGHTHIASNISGLDTAIEDKFDTSIAAGSGISLVYDSGNSTLTISVTGLSGGGGTSGPISTTDITDFNSGVSGLLGDYALTSGKLNQFSTTTSSEFSTIISNAAGSGLLVLNDSPTLTGIPLAPTAPSGTNNNQIATTEFVQSSIDNYASSGSFILPVASDTVLGGVKVGSGLTISSGVLSTIGGGGSGEDTLLRSLFLPPAPTSVTATGGNAQVLLSWTAPTGVISQAPVTDYVVQYSSNSGSTWTTFSEGTSTATSATVTGLTNGTEYMFRVAAVNNIGIGAYSAASSAVTPTTITPDPYFSSVVLLIHADGNGSTFVDSSPTPKAITANGDATQSATQSKWGEKSLYLDGGGDYLSVAGVPAIGTSEFALEFWMRTLDANADQQIIGSSNNGDFNVAYRPSQFGPGGIGVGGNYNWDLIANVSILSNTWHYVVIARQSGTIRLYLDGALAISANNYASLPQNAAMEIGSKANGTQFPFLGYLDDIRLTIGSSRSYTGSTIPVPTSAFPDA